MAKRKNINNLNKEDNELINEKMFPIRNNKGNSIIDFKINIKCKNNKQKDLNNSIKNNEITFCKGSAGTGKSYVTFATALELLKTGLYKQILIVVPTVQNDLEIGFLKGTLDEKIEPFTIPHTKTIEKILSVNNQDSHEIVSKLKKINIIEFACVSFMRGITIDNTIVVVEECQNLPKTAFKTLLTRIGSNSKYIFSGDEEQCDNKEIRRNSNQEGLNYAISKLKDIPNIGVVEFGIEDVIRNPIISKILERWH